MENTITLRQILDIKHALGGVIKRKSYRNHFMTGLESESWNKLVDMGFAEKQDKGKEWGGICYFVTDKAIEYFNMRGIK